MELIKRVIKKLLTKEMIAYIIVGILTTVVNLVCFDILCNKLQIHELLGNIIAWVVAVTFAYVTNNFFVFGSGLETKKREIEKICKFFSARLVTLGIEEVGILIFVTWLSFPKMPVKYGLAIIVIVVNYIFSKLYIFTNKKKERME